MSEKSASSNDQEYNYDEEPIWFEDFENRNVACLIASTGVRKYGELILFTPIKLLELGLDKDEIIFVKKPLERRGLSLAEELI